MEFKRDRRVGDIQNIDSRWLADTLGVDHEDMILRILNGRNSLEQYGKMYITVKNPVATWGRQGKLSIGRINKAVAFLNDKQATIIVDYYQKKKITKPKFEFKR